MENPVPGKNSCRTECKILQLLIKAQHVTFLCICRMIHSNTTRSGHLQLQPCWLNWSYCMRQGWHIWYICLQWGSKGLHVCGSIKYWMKL